MAQMITLLDLRIISYITKDDDLNGAQIDICMVLSQGAKALYEFMRNDDHTGLSPYTEKQFKAAFDRIRVANWPQLTPAAFKYAVGRDRIMLPHEVSVEQRVRIAGCWIVQERNIAAMQGVEEALRRGDPIKNLTEMSEETALTLPSKDATRSCSIPSVTEASKIFDVEPSAIKASWKSPILP
ncbi:MAG: hypothetical protein U5L98_17135 [Halomonas sp.]|uniref:hypothetical protein n=1 Tax=Halomonas sp. TaxID=1486246 RepID=UPI002ACD3806|nr:hypothetical protein [Halomonas sp.]MDZ7854301.1 hypothetical protein [Halomonas sp.]